jgi:hypothetical protein
VKRETHKKREKNSEVEENADGEITKVLKERGGEE